MPTAPRVTIHNNGDIEVICGDGPAYVFSGTKGGSAEPAKLKQTSDAATDEDLRPFPVGLPGQLAEEHRVRGGLLHYVLIRAPSLSAAVNAEPLAQWLDQNRPRDNAMVVVQITVPSTPERPVLRLHDLGQLSEVCAKYDVFVILVTL